MPFEVSIVTAPKRSIAETREDIAIVKHALLFADHITLFSPNLAMADAVRRTAGEQRDFLAALEILSLTDTGFSRDSFDAVRKILRKSTTRQNEAERKIASAMRATQERLREIADGLVASTGYHEIQPAIAEGLVRIDDLGTRQHQDVGMASVVAAAVGCEDRNQANLMNRFIETVERTVLQGTTYPLTDTVVSSLVESGIREGRFLPLEGRKKKAKASALSCSILRNLPIFNTPIEDILEVRSEVESCALAYRAAVAGFAAFIKSEAWERGFEDEASHVYQTSVLPEIQQIEKAISASRFVGNVGRAMLDQVLTKRWASGTLGLLAGIGVLAADVPASVVAGISLGGTLASVGVDTANRIKSEKEKAEGNGFFLVYKAEKALLGGSAGRR